MVDYSVTCLREGVRGAGERCDPDHREHGPEVGTVQCGRALLPEGAVISVTITATVVAGYTGTLENIARVLIAAGAVLLAATRRRRV